MASSPSPEVRSIVIRTHDLTTALSNEPLGVAGILLGKGFISSETMSKMLVVSYTPREKATILIEAVRNKVELAPLKFPELLEILSEVTCAKEVVESLRSTYQGLIQEPTKQRSVDIDVTIENFEDRFHTLKKEILRQLVERHVDTSTVINSLILLPMMLKMEYGKAIQELLPSFSNIEGINELFFRLNPLFSFLDYGLLKYIIKIFGSNRLMQDMTTYSNDMQIFMKETIIKQLIDHLPGQTEIPPKFSLIEAKIGQNMGECTLAQLNTIRIRYCPEVQLTEIVFHCVAVVESRDEGSSTPADKYDTTALIKASGNGDIDAVRRLLKTKNLRKDDELLVFMAASKNGHDEIIALLLDHGVDVNILDDNEQCALMIASQHGHVQIVQRLLHHGAQPNLKDSNGLSSLMMASQNSHHDTAQVLLKYGAEIDSQSSNGWTALKYASWNNRIKVVEILLKHGAHVDEEFLTQLSPTRHQEILRMLKKQLGIKLIEEKCILCCGEISSNGGTLRGAGIEIQIPKDTITPGECTTIAVYGSVEGPSYSEQSKLYFISPVFHIECIPDIQFKREITVTIEHFARLETKSDLNDLVFLVSKNGEEFCRSGQVESQIGSNQGKVSVLHFCRFAFGKKKNPKYKYSMLVALPKNCCSQYRPVWAFFSISVDSKTYKKIFETYLKKKFDDHPFYPIASTLIDSVSDEIGLTIPEHTGEYRILPDIHPPKILKRRVDEASKEGDVYPPRIRLDIGLSTTPRSSLMCHVPIQGIDNVESFALRANYEDVGAHGQHEPDDQCNTSHHELFVTQLSANAAKWRDIGTHLGFRQGELDIIESKPNLHQGAPKSWLSAMLAEWLEWAPGDQRGSNQVATLSSLKYAVKMAGLGRTASVLTINVS